MARVPKTKEASKPKIERPKRVIPSSLPKSTSTKKSTPKKPKSKIATKKSSTKKKSTSGSRKSKPTYEKMILKALKNLGGRVSSGIAIAKYIEANYPVSDTFKRYLRVALRKGVDNGDLIQIRNSYKLGTVTKEVETKRKSRTSTRSTENKKRTSKTPEKISPAKPKGRKTKNSSSSTPSPSSSPKKKVIAPKEKKSTKRSKVTEISSPSSVESIDNPKKPHGLKSDFLWQYFDGKWKNYDVEASNTVEEVYQSYLTNRGGTDVRAVKSGQWEYQVDFMAMKQTNLQHENHTTRNIRRVKTN